MRYLGGKGKCKEIIKIVQSLIPRGGVYWEPFCGSCKILEQIKNCRRYGSDIDPHIIDLLRSVRDGWVPPKNVTEADHKEWMGRRDERNPMLGFIGYGCCFGGSFFGGFARDDVGTNYALNTRRSLLRQKPYLEGVELRVRNYLRPFWGEDVPHVIYCDPPYEGTHLPGNKKDKFSHDQFWEWVRERSRESSVLVSEYSCPVEGASILWQKTNPSYVRRKDGSKKVEKLFCLDRKVAKKVGFGYF